MNKSPEYHMSALMFHLEPMCVEPEPPECGDCGSVMKLVGPELLFFACEICHATTFEWRPYNGS